MAHVRPQIIRFLVQRNLPRPCYSQPHASVCRLRLHLSKLCWMYTSSDLICMVQFPIASPTNYIVARVSEVFHCVKTMEHSIYVHLLCQNHGALHLRSLWLEGSHTDQYFSKLCTSLSARQRDLAKPNTAVLTLAVTFGRVDKNLCRK